MLFVSMAGGGYPGTPRLITFVDEFLILRQMDCTVPGFTSGLANPAAIWTSQTDLPQGIDDAEPIWSARTKMGTNAKITMIVCSHVMTILSQ